METAYLWMDSATVSIRDPNLSSGTQLGGINHNHNRYMFSTTCLYLNKMGEDNKEHDITEYLSNFLCSQKRLVVHNL
jgi:hypothetical protein